MAPPTLIAKNLPYLFWVFLICLLSKIQELFSVLMPDDLTIDESIILGSSSHLQRVYIITTTANTRHLANTSSLMWR